MGYRHFFYTMTNFAEHGSGFSQGFVNLLLSLDRLTPIAREACTTAYQIKKNTKTEDIEQLFEQFERAVNEFEGVECRSARDLQKLLGYKEWRNFEKSIQKAKDSCANTGGDISGHFVDLNEMVGLGSGAQRETGPSRHRSPFGGQRAQDIPTLLAQFSTKTKPSPAQSLSVRWSWQNPKFQVF